MGKSIVKSIVKGNWEFFFFFFLILSCLFFLFFLVLVFYFFYFLFFNTVLTLKFVEALKASVLYIYI